MSRLEQDLIAGPVEGYKIVNDDMTCRDFQFEIGTRHVLPNDDYLELCENGFHFCKYPSGPWSYYATGRVFKVRAYGVLAQEGSPGADYKMVCEEIELAEEVADDGDDNTGDDNTGDRNTGDRNTGDGNTGDDNTGDDNTGDRNTGDRNTGYGNQGDYHSGSLNFGEAPIYLFNEITKVKRDDIDWYLVRQLSDLLASDADFDYAPFMSLPNATKKMIKTLHDAHKQTRASQKGA